MLKPERMSKITIVSPKTIAGKIVNRLYEMKICHIVDHKKTEGLDIGSPFENADKISEILIKIESLNSLLDIKGRYKEETYKEEIEKKCNISDIEKNVDILSKKAIYDIDKLKEIDEKIKALNDKKEILEKLSIIDISLEFFSDYETIDYIVGTIDIKEKDVLKLKYDLNKITKKNELKIRDYNSKKIISVFFEKGKRNDIISLLSKNNFLEINLSLLGNNASENGIKGRPIDILKKVKEKIKALESEKSKIKKRIDDIKGQWSGYLLKNYAVLSAELEKASSPLRFGATEEAVIIKGWVPKKRLQKVIEEIDNLSKQKVYIKIEEAHEHEDVPIKLKNPKIVRPFEFFMDLYTLPTYHEIDPTFLMFLTFPIFYGFMLGDIGYGLVTLVLFLILRSRVGKDFGRLVNAMILASISSIIFGFVFGEFFGLEEIGHFKIPHLLNRLEGKTELMIMAVVIGAIHVNIGLLIGFYNVWKEHGFKKAVFEKLSWLVFELSIVLIALSYIKYPIMGYLIMKPFGFVILIISIIMLYIGEGAKGIIELPSIFSHMMSYARLMAVGLASVILAVVVNDLAGKLFAAGIFGIMGGVILLVIGHIINIGLGLISPFLHSLRLHYVEFFTKFYRGGGMRFLPFGAEKD
ncbi:MAG: V-type ATP synthase subunit I [Candidatus Woesearchaeota archaeon]|nr:V-type ATP synthase subunit I [Candidatus Woesearchaeota archaeon]